MKKVATILSLMLISSTVLSSATPALETHTSNQSIDNIPAVKEAPPMNSQSDLTQAQISESISAVLTAMDSVIQRLPRKLVLERKSQDQALKLAISAWSSPTLTLEVHGTRTLGLSEDGLKLLLCHEMGHIAGGVPTRGFVYSDIPFSEEGQADYFSTSGCLPAVFSREDNSKFLNLIAENKELQNVCKTEIKDEDKAMCARITLASLNASRFLYQVYDAKFMGVDPGIFPSLALNAGSQRIVGRMNYPLPQCRLDTFLKGFKCRSNQLPVSYVLEPSVSTKCNQAAIDVPRPSCWFNGNW